MRMRLFLIITVSVASVSCEDFAPIYSHSYANVYYQRAAEGTPRYGVKFNLPAEQQEAITLRNEILTNFDELNPTSEPDTTTDPNSEKVNTKQTHPPPTKYSQHLELEEEFEPTEEPDQEEELEEPILKHRGVYYIYHPNGILQQVVFETRDDPENMQYFAQFNYHDVPPVVEPILTYDPDHQIFHQIHEIH